MRGRNLITLPEGCNPGALLTFAKVEALFGIEEETLRSWRSRQSRNGFPAFKVEGRVFVRCMDKPRRRGGRGTSDSLGRDRDVPDASSLILKGVSL